MINQLLSSLWFYIIFSLCSGAGLWLTLRLFPGKLPLAYFSAKFLGLSIFGIFIWLLASLHILNYQNTVFVVVLFMLALLGGYFLVRKLFADMPSIKVIIKRIAWLELASLALFFAYLWLRSYNPAANGTERFMDMSMMNASLKTSYFPFIDSWYAGKVINYYYFGHYLLGLITKLSGVSSFLTYNYSIGLIYSGSFMLSACLVYEIVKSKWFAFLAGFFVTTAGSLFYASCVISSWFKDQPICSYASSTRLYTPSYIINEVPSYSFTVGDLHAHFIALPFFILNLILIYALVKAIKPTIWHIAALVGSLSVSALINPSDATTLGMLLTFFWLYRAYPIYKTSGSIFNFIKAPALRPWLYLAAGVMMGVLVITLPFLINFQSPVLGFGFAPIFAKTHNLLMSGYQYPTPFLALLGMWGAFLIGIWFVLDTYKEWWQEHQFLVLLFIGSLFLIVFVEFFYVKDIYHIANPPYFRANTVFKFGYHTWTMLAISFSSFLALAYERLKIKRWQAVISWPLTAIVFLSAFYPYQAMVQFYPAQPFGQTLDATDFFNRDNKDDLETINWINKNISGRKVIVEAVGDSYSYFGRMSVFTGQITLMGWKSHEWTWRFEGKEAAKIKEKDPNATVETGYGAVSIVGQDVGFIYQSDDLVLTRRLLREYGVDYVYVGNQEKLTYPNLREDKLAQLGTVVFQSANSKLYKIK